MKLKEILYEINKEKDLNKDNVIKKIKEKLKAEDKDEWEKAGFNVNHLFQDNESMLYLAIQNNFNAVANALIYHIVGVSGKDKDGTTLLHIAVNSRYGYIMDVLLKAEGIDVNAKDENELTPLHYTVKCKHVEDIMDVLLKAKGIDVNVQDKDERTPLHLAAKEARKEMVKVLLQNNANVDAKDKDERTPLHLAAECPFGEVIEVLLQNNANVDAKDKDERTPLHLAAINNHMHTVDALLEAGRINVNAKDKDGKTPLHLAISAKARRAVEVLLQKGANINVQDNDGTTPLSLVIEHGNAEVVLHWAAKMGNVEIVKKLLKAKGINVNAKDKDGKTPLHLACSAKARGVIEVLLQKGADVNAEDRDEKTPLNLVIEYGNAEVVLHWAAKMGNVEIVEKLLEVKGIGVNAKDKDGKTPLHLACSAKYQVRGVIEVLLRNGADVNAEDKDGKTPKDLDEYSYIENFLKEAKEKQLNEEKNNLPQDKDDNTGTVHLEEAEEKQLNEEKNNLPQDKDDNKDTVHLLGKTEPTSVATKIVDSSTEHPTTESTSAAKKGVFAGGATALLGTVAAVALFATGTVAVELVPVVIAVATIVAAALAVGSITYMMSKPSTEMNEVGDLEGNNKVTHLQEHCI